MAGQLFRNRLGAHRRRTRRIYISRRDAIWRKVVNENDVMTLLGRYGFELIELSGMPIRQMIDLMASAEVVVGPSGANLSGAMFCQPGSAVVELTFEPYIRKYYFQATSTISECRHYKVRGTPLSNPENYTRWDFSVPLPELETAIRMAIDNIS
jgi:capsular polysaccharide biosynthesis protein